jgi:ABC-2 type transport system ATP-binding protein
VTVVLATHLMDEAERLADQVVIVDRGRCVAAGSPIELTGGSRRLEDVFFELTTPAQR